MTDAKKMELADRLWGYAADCDTDGMPEQANDLRTASTTLRTASNQLTAGAAVREALETIRKYCDENLGPSRSSLLNKIAHVADEALAALTAPAVSGDVKSSD